MAEPLVLSGSSVGTYRRCPQWWYFEYVERQTRPMRLKQARGLAAHEAVELDLDHRVRTWQHLPVEILVEKFEKQYDEYARESPDVQGKDTKAGIREAGIRAIIAWRANVAPSIDPRFVELSGQFMFDGVHYSWTADLIDWDWLVRDWKFVAKKPSDKHWDGGPDYTINMQGYELGVGSLLDRKMAGWQLDQMVCLKRDTPYLVQDFHDPITEDEEQEFKDTVGEVHDRILAGQFPALGLNNGACSWCPFADGTCKPEREARLADEARRQPDYE